MVTLDNSRFLRRGGNTGFVLQVRGLFYIALLGVYYPAIARCIDVKRVGKGEEEVRRRMASGVHVACIHLK